MLPLSDNENLAITKTELEAHYKSVTPRIRLMVAGAVKTSARSLTLRFYQVLLTQPNAHFFLDQETVRKRLQSSLEIWLIELFSTKSKDVEKIANRQVDIGKVHARIQIPIFLVMKGVRELKNGITENLKNTKLSETELADAIHFSSILFDLAFAMMTTAYDRAAQRAARSDEELRLFSLGQDMTAEKERQRAAISEWAQTFFFETQALGRPEKTELLSTSDFGRWFLHRANLLFDRSEEYKVIVGIVGDVDRLADQLKSDDGAHNRLEILHSIKAGVERISKLLSSLFDRHIGIERARDPLTRLLDRRFLIPALSREIDVHRTSRRPFSVIIFDIDDLDRMKQEHGLAGIDEIVQQTALMLFNLAHTGDTVFRIGQGTFLLIRVQTDHARSLTFAEAIIQRYEATHFTLMGKPHFQNRLNFAVAEYEGHPDPRNLIARVEQALREKT